MQKQCVCKKIVAIGPMAAFGTFALIVLAAVGKSAMVSESRPGSGERPTSEWWSLAPLERPAVPLVDAHDSAWVRTPIDAFVAARLRQEGLSPSPPALRRTLIRRVTFDLIGLPPTPQEIDDFVEDSAPDAYERLVDRLLASPRYGERWARHWLDLAHFAETHGHDQDRIREHAWPYRDYVIEAFNSDRPYGRFVEEQIAADALFPRETHLTPALGFIAAGPWDESSLRDIREDTIDRQIGHYLDRDDMVATVMSTFTSMTVHCARCHDHKFDPITQRDYYGLQAVFAGVGRANRAFDLDPQVHSRRQSLREELQKLERADPELLARLREPDALRLVAIWEERLGKEVVPWQPLDPDRFTAALGSTLTKESDSSVFANGTRPEKDTYTITARTNLRKVTAVRLEVLDDSRLPMRGPGRQDNGNLHLNEIRVEAVVPPHGDEPERAVVLPIESASADFNQTGWTIQHAIDGQAATAWGIFPEVGKPHEAVFELKEPAAIENAMELRVTLEQQHGGGHLIGRFRLSVTDAPSPVRVSRQPARIAELLRVPPEARSPEQRDELAIVAWRAKIEHELAQLPAPRLVYAAASDFAPDGSHKPPRGPRPVHVLNRGDITKPGEEAAPGALGCISDLPSQFEVGDLKNESDRRAALAKWISEPRNPLTWRSIVNRVWHHHFGRGIVDTPNDFGRMGTLPSHPELLDWLAVEFLEAGGSLKQVHRLIVTSATYRQVSTLRDECVQIDADNRLLWRMNRARLDAESVRDAVLQISGRLDLSMGGPSARQFGLKPGIHVTPLVNYGEFDWAGPGSNRRSIYRFIFRTLPDPFMDCLDCADASQLTAARTVSVTPLQALAMLNNEFLLTHSEFLARRLEQFDGDLEQRCELACRLTLGRSLSPEERSELVEFAARRGLAALARLLFNSNEFMFLN